MMVSGTPVAEWSNIAMIISLVNVLSGYRVRITPRLITSPLLIKVFCRKTIPNGKVSDSGRCDACVALPFSASYRRALHPPNSIRRLKFKYGSSR